MIPHGCGTNLRNRRVVSLSRRPVVTLGEGEKPKISRDDACQEYRLAKMTRAAGRSLAEMRTARPPMQEPARYCGPTATTFLFHRWKQTFF